MTSRRVLLDTGPLRALFDENDELHKSAENFFGAKRFRYFLTTAVVTEVAHHLGRDRSKSRSLAALTDFYGMVSRGHFSLVDLVAEDYGRLAELRAEYQHLKPDFADLTLLVAAERSNIGDIVTVDKRDFNQYQWQPPKGKRKMFRLWTLN